jgi:hypothetical protein
MLAVLWLAALSWVAIAAASCAGIGDACQFDSDCNGGNLCIDDTCYASCSDERDCEPPYEFCQAHTRQASEVDETVKACVDEDFGQQNNTPENCEDSGDCCSDDAECVAHFGDDAAVCGSDGRCIIPVARPAHGVLIRDRSAVDPIQDPADGGLGADIAALYVRASGSDEPLGVGVTADYAPANSAGESADIFDGSAPSLDADGQCVAGIFDESTASLGGEGGYLLVTFEDADGQRLQLNRSWELVVIEWGANCGQPDDTDVFDVYFCSAQRPDSPDMPVSIDPRTHCERQLNTNRAAGHHVSSLDTDG